jgi:Mg-chelatase subunit ChlD
MLFKSSNSSPCASRVIERPEFDSDKEEKYAYLTSEEKDLSDRLSKLLGECDREKRLIEEKMRIKTLTRNDEEKLQMLIKEKNEVEEKLKETRTRKVTYSKLLATKDDEEKERLEKLKEVMKMIRKSETVDLCFMVDCTGSMASHIDAVMVQIHTIVSKLKKTSADMEIKVSFLGYRDICDGSNQFTILDFTSDIDFFQVFVGSTVATGGGDGPENIGGALQKANQLSWTQGTRVIIHIADAPAHGSQYTDWLDEYPNGVGISLPDELKKLEEKQVLFYFAHIARTNTQKMVDTLNLEMGRKYITEIELGSPEELTKLVTTTVRKSIKITHGGGGSADDTKYAEDPISSSKPSNWADIPSRVATIERVRPYSSAEDLKTSSLTMDCMAQSCQIKISPTVMGKGCIRAAMYGKCDGKDVIFKKYLKSEVDFAKDEARYLQALEEAEIARFLAEKFNESVGEQKVSFVESALVKVKIDGNDELFFMESPLPEGKTFIKYVNNAAHWDEDELDAAFTLPKFAEWSHTFSGGYMMVADLQGVEKDGEYFLTDPVILCKDSSRFGVTNLGEEMIDKYLNSLDAF